MQYTHAFELIAEQFANRWLFEPIDEETCHLIADAFEDIAGNRLCYSVVYQKEQPSILLKWCYDLGRQIDVLFSSGGIEITRRAF